MIIDVRQVKPYVDVSIEADMVQIHLGLLNKQEALELSQQLIEAAVNLRSFIDNV